MKPGDEFKFEIQWPKREVDRDNHYQLFTIYAQFPTVVYSVGIKPGHRMADEDQKRLAISELKVRLIQDIANAEFKTDSMGESK